MKNQWIWTFSLMAMLSGCGSDNDGETNPDDGNSEPTTEELKKETVNVLTDSGNPKVWKVSSAQVQTDGAESKGTVLNISNNFNIVDDEFIFSGGLTNGALEWRRRHDVNLNASSLEETLLDYYRSPLESSFTFVGESVSDLTASGFQFNVSDDGVVTATLAGSTTAKSGKKPSGDLSLTLVEKEPDDYKQSLNELVFTEAFTFESASVEESSPGMIGSDSANSFFFENREFGLRFDNPDNPLEIPPERVIKFNLDDLSQEEFVNYDFDDSDFASKQLHIVNNQLISIGSQKISAYDYDLSDPSTFFYNNLISEEYGTKINYTRFGMAVQDNAVYIIGGAFADDPEGGSFFDIEETKKIYKWDIDTQTLSLFATLPETRYGARGTIVNDKMYIFGGSKSWTELSPQSTIYIVDMNNPNSIQTLDMGAELRFSFVQKYENLIFVGGYKILTDPSGKESTLGVFNTENNSFNELSHNLTNPNGEHAIHQMAVFNGKLYLLYGDSNENLATEEEPYPFEKWTIYEADIE